MASEPYKLEKWVWADADFKKMGWHDVQIHGMAAINERPRLELLLDIDYIFKWVPPKKGERSFRFWLAPATLVFEDVFKLQLNIDAYQPDWEIDDVQREERKTAAGLQGWLWTLVLHQGNISFWSTGFKQYIRRRPTLHNMPSFNFDEREGVSFKKGRVSNGPQMG